MPRLLIIKPSSLGDIVHGLQLATSLQAQVPELTIDWVARDLFAPLVRQARSVRRIYEFRRHASASAFWALLRELRTERYDYVFDLQGLLRSAVMTLAAKAPMKVGRVDAREGARWAYGRRVPLPPRGRQSHAVEILLQFCPVLGAEPRLRGQLEFDHAPEVPTLPATGGGRPIVIFPDSRRPEKNWPRFPELTERLLQTHPERTIVWAGSERVEGDARWAAAPFLNLTARTSLGTLPGVLRQAALVIANDSGPMHLAAALDVPVLALFGPTDPQRYGPYPPDAHGPSVLVAPEGNLQRLTAATVATRVAELVASPRPAL